jgi:hypothetical protein
MNDKVKKWLPWALASIFALGCCVGAPVAGVGVWLAWSERPGAIIILPGNKAQAVNAPPENEWGYQDIQDHLAKKGIKTSRLAGRFGAKLGMWFQPGNGEPITGEVAFMMNDNIFNHQMLNDKRFFMEDMGTPIAAKESVRHLADVQQKQATAWNKYVIYGCAEKRAEIKKALP